MQADTLTYGPWTEALLSVRLARAINKLRDLYRMERQAEMEYRDLMEVAED